MAARLPRLVYLVHALPGRARFRLPWLREDKQAAPPIADALSALAGMQEVQLRPHTGSVLCIYDREQLELQQIAAALCAQTGVPQVIRPGEESRDETRRMLEAVLREGSDVSRAIVSCVKGLQLDFLRATGGQLSLPSLMAIALWTAAGLEIVGESRLRLPEWHQLVWWGFRSFHILEENLFENGPDPLAEFATPDYLGK